MLARVARALTGAPRGSVLVQLRDKDLDPHVLVRVGRDLRAICTAAGARLLVNGNVVVARAVEADGVHLVDGDARQVMEVRAAFGEDGATMLVGASTHDTARAASRTAEGADFVTLGPVWETESKPGATGIGVAPLTEAAAAGACVFALGGIGDAERVRAARAAGAHGVAVIRGVLAAEDPRAAMAALCAALEEPRGA
jgi:thiamine-phosphate pyrophosphorylase